MVKYRIDTTVTFVGNNWIYILMFDMKLDNFESPKSVSNKFKAKNAKTKFASQ